MTQNTSQDSGPVTASLPAKPPSDDPHSGRTAGWSLRLRLMLTLLLVFGAIQVLMSVLWLVSVRRTTGRLFDQTLVRHAHSVAGLLARDGGSPSDASVAEAVGSASPSAWCGRLTVTVYDTTGQAIAGTARPPLPYAPPAGSGERAAIERVSVPDGPPGEAGQAPGRATSVGFTTTGGQRFVVVVGAGDSFLSAVTDEVAQQIVYATPIGLLTAAVAGWLIAGLAVKPLQRLGQIARSIRPDNLQSPIELGSSATELTKLQTELDEMRRRLDSGYEAQERFVANVSHEIKTPIATVLTEAQTLPKGIELPGEARRFIESTADEMRRLGRLVESFLMLTRVRHGKPLHTTTRTVGVNDMVMDSLMHCWKPAEQHGVRLLPELADEEERDLTVCGDPELLRTMLDNLVRNAIRFSPRGEAVAICVTADERRARICVRDKGPSIPPELIESMFDRYGRAKAEEKLGRGSGLGLEIAQGIAELHGGQITVSNLDAGGCEFCATLPLSSEPKPPVALSPRLSTPDSAPLLDRS